MDSFVNILGEVHDSLNILLVLGIAVFGGAVGANFFKRIRVPQVVGYVVVGVVIGESGLGLVSEQTVEQLALFSMFALGVIGFMIGGELRGEVFRKYGKQFFAILIAEGVTAFVFVGLLTFGACWYYTGDVNRSVAIGLLLGAISSATAPAATVSVLWEYKTRGPLTNTVLAIVALDDGLSLLLFGIASSMAAVFLGGGGGESVWTAVPWALVEILGAIVVGAAGGGGLTLLLRRVRDDDKALVLILAMLLLTLGVSIALGVGLILAAMSFGVVLANLMGPRHKSTFALMEKFSPPIYVLFFVLAGAHLVIDNIAGWMIVVVVVYLVGRTGGKTFGAWLGGKLSKAPETVVRYLGLCLLSQAGVAIGLAIISSHMFKGELGQAIILIVMTTTFVVEIVGPLSVKLGVKRAGEVGLNITEDDLIATYKVGDVMDRQSPLISAGTSLSQVLQIVSNTDRFYYPVVDRENKLAGAVTMNGIRNTFTTQELNDWLVAIDIAEPVTVKLVGNVELGLAFEMARSNDAEQIPVVQSQEDDTVVGVLDCPAVRRSLSAEVLERQRKADKMHGVVV